MEYKGDFRSEQWQKEIQKLAGISLTELENRLDEFVEFTTSLGDDFTYEEIDAKWKSLELLHQIQLLEIDNINPDLWRVRTNLQEHEKGMHVQSFSHPPLSLNAMGRANRPHHPVFYCSNSKKVAMFEARMKTGDVGYLSRWKIRHQPSPEHPLRVHPFWNFKNNSPLSQLNIKHREKVEALNKQYGGNANEHLNLIFERFDDALMHDNFILSSWVAHRIIYQQARVIDGILYPSNAVDHHGGNFAFHPNYVQENLQLQEIWEFQFTDDGVPADAPKGSYKFTFTIKGYAQKVGNALLWQHGNAMPQEKIDEFFENMGDNAKVERS